jgi:heme/copper-type cytochrome/quinol oxidase subunit 2
MDFSSTNIDLGPSINSSDHGTILFVIVLAVVFVTMFVAVYRRKKAKGYKRKKKHR